MPALPRAVVLDGHTTNPGDNPWTRLEALTRLTVYERTLPHELIERAQGAEILLTNKTPISAEQIAALPALKFIGVLATGYNIVDTEAARARGIPVSNVPEYSTRAVAQHTLALLLELCHRCGEHSQAVHCGEWSRSPDFCFWKSPQVGLWGKRIGIAGNGRIGKQVAALAEAFGMRVQIFSRHTPPDGDRFVSWEEWLESSDVLSLHCALTEATRQMINAEALRRVKPSAFLLNTSRGALIDETALATALHEGRLAGAACDVLSTEPPAPDNPLLGAPRCLLTPHIAWTALEARRSLMETMGDNLAAYLRGAPIHVVNEVAAAGAAFCASQPPGSNSR